MFNSVNYTIVYIDTCNIQHRLKNDYSIPFDEAFYYIQDIVKGLKNSNCRVIKVNIQEVA